VNRKLFTHVPLFRFCDVRVMVSLVDRLKSAIYMPGDFVLREGDEGRGLHFINRGSVLVLKMIGSNQARGRTLSQAAGAAADSHSGHRHKVLKTLHENSFFGERSLLHGGPMNASARPALLERTSASAQQSSSTAAAWHDDAPSPSAADSHHHLLRADGALLNGLSRRRQHVPQFP
jgi:hypothetical protein